MICACGIVGCQVNVKNSVLAQASDSIPIKRDYLRNGQLHNPINEHKSSACARHKEQLFILLYFKYFNDNQ